MSSNGEDASKTQNQPTKCMQREGMNCPNQFLRKRDEKPNGLRIGSLPREVQKKRDLVESILEFVGKMKGGPAGAGEAPVDINNEEVVREEGKMRERREQGERGKKK